jgi:hypothetical protein
MANALIATALKTVGTTVGINFAIKCVSMITSTTQGIYSITQNIYNTNPCNEIAKVLRETDIELRIQILETFIAQIDTSKIDNQATLLCLDSLKQCLQNIEKELKQIHDRLLYNKSLWFASSIRSYSFKNNVIRMLSYSKILSQRQKMLFELLKTPQNQHIYKDKKEIKEINNLEIKKIQDYDEINNI